MNFEDDLSKDIAAAIDSVKPESPASSPGDAAPPPSKDGAPTPSDAIPASGGERARDESGKFVAKDKTEKPEIVTPVDKPVVETPPKAAPAAASGIPPPPNWKGAGKVEWSRLPQHIQQEIRDDYTRVSTTEGELSRFKAAIGDRAPTLAAQYGSVENAIQSLLAAADFSAKNPAGFIQWFLQRSGIDPAQLFGQGAPQAIPAADGQPQPWQQEATALRSQLQQMQQHLQQAQLAPLQAEIESFQNDPAHPYFNDVRLHMKALIESGTVKGTGRQLLENAYQEAIWTRPDIRTRLLEDERKKFADENAAKVAQAKQAAGSITGSPAGAKTPNDEPDEDITATVRRQVSRLVA